MKNTLLIAKGLYKHRIDSDIDDLREVTVSMYSCMNKEVKKIEEYIEKRKDKMSQERYEDLVEYMSDDYWKYAEQFPNILGYLLLVRYYSFLEDTLRSICLVVQQVHSKKLEYFIKSEKELALIEKYFKYMKDAGIDINEDLPGWSEIKNSVRLLRNAIAHNDGHIGGHIGTKKYDDLLAYIEQENDCLSIKNNQVDISRTYIEKVADILEKFFKDLLARWEPWCKARG